ncbi:MAG: D-alanyl-D-alanine carboxypeptidase dacC precursor, partial [Pseudomonadota bacterium]
MLGSGLMMCVCAHSYAETYISSSSSQLPLSFFTDRGVPERAIGISVAVLNTRENPNVVRWLGHRSGEPMNPASTEKLITTRAAWSILGPDYRHRTTFLTTGTIHNGRLKGSVYVKGGGDPKLVQEDLQAIVSQLRAAGIQHIEGDLVLDGTRFAEPAGDPNAFDGMGFKPYNVTPHAAMLNFKAVKVRLSRSANGRLTGEIEPALTGLRLNTAVKQVRGDCSRNQIQIITKTNLLEVQGRLGRGCPGFEAYVAVYDHLQFAHRLFSATWRAAGGRFQGRVREGPTPAEARSLLEWVSPRPLQELVADINKL